MDNFEQLAEIIRPTPTPATIQDECHRLIHEVAYHVRTGEIETAQKEIKQIDDLLHELLK